ncbi:PMEI domain-containing protein [Forsythia ovata]|uniref:PMEI domain-containing protein n=1 Tax=Forsythia ovata TaxID=205694 RepID=A0ABD1TT37_9LAMI
MESSNENLKATLLNFEDQTPQPTARSTRNKKTLIFTSLILFTLIAAAGILLLVQNRTARSKSFDAYFKGSKKFYCHLTMYPRLCFTSMSPILNRSSLIWTPSPIFSTSLQIAIAELKNTTNSISNAVLSISNDSPTRSTFHKCSSLLTDSLSRLNNSLATLTVDLDIDALTYTEADNIRAWNMAAVAGAEDCFVALQDIESRVEIEQEKIAVNEVKFKVDKARMNYSTLSNVSLSQLSQTLGQLRVNPNVETQIDEQRSDKWIITTELQNPKSCCEDLKKIESTVVGEKRAKTFSELKEEEKDRLHSRKHRPLTGQQSSQRPSWLNFNPRSTTVYKIDLLKYFSRGSRKKRTQRI